MSSTAVSCACAVLLVAGCASSRPPPAASAASPSPDWAASAGGAATTEDFQFTPETDGKAKTADAPVPLKVDNASSNDVKHAHLNAAAR